MAQLIHLILGSTMKLLLEDRVGLKGLELGLEIGDVVGVLAAIGAATGIGEIVPIVMGLFSRSAP